jgi:Bacterial dnaA protein helix-turn-helix
MATVVFSETRVTRLSLATIDAVVSARLGPTRIAGNEQRACFNRQIAMYLAKYIGGWSTTQIGRFYNGRDHSTVCYGIQRIQSLRDSDPDVDALITELNRQLGAPAADGTRRAGISAESASISELTVDQLADRVAARVCE